VTAPRTAPATRRAPFAAALLVAWPVAAQAYRPFNSTDAAVADRGDLEIEFGPLGYLVQPPERSLVAPSLVLNWGFAERWEAVLEARHFVQLGATVEEPRLRVEDTALSLKHVLREGSLQRKSGVSVALELSALLPTVNGEPGVGAEGTVILSRRWPDLTVHLNGALAWTRAHEPGVFGGLILEARDAWEVRPVAEVFVESERARPTTTSVLAGAIWRARDSLSFDAAVRFAREAGVATTELRLGLTYAFEVTVRR
jgi:hypothetical protein